MSTERDEELQEMVADDRRGKVMMGVAALVVIAVSAIGMMIYFGQVAAVPP